MFVCSLSQDPLVFQYEFSASFLEIYNESIRDLLGEGKDDVKHEIKMVSSKKSEIHVTNLTTVPVPDADKVSAPCMVCFFQVFVQF